MQTPGSVWIRPWPPCYPTIREAGSRAGSNPARSRSTDSARRARDRVQGGEAVVVRATVAADTAATPQAMPLDLRYEDEHLLVIDKPAGLVVHPGAGNPDRTLQNALLALDPELATLPRAGIVHRLDKDTSGLLVVARSLSAHTALVRDARGARDPSRLRGRRARRVDRGRHDRRPDRPSPRRSRPHGRASGRPRGRDRTTA